ncbi:hypothetical protein A1507_19235 [Methylomonas koyamae]|uniref:Uncharacterized protein n=2 Tax=Methylomonas koyamae TaxID=702114 RepID=A0A177N333_9GAMM|nr:hypothetical protein A1507_19235 [Methylomonas koyamae]
MLIVDWQLDQAAGHDEVMTLAKVLLQQGAELVAVCPGWVDFSEQAFEYDSRLPVGQRWVQVREKIVIYRRRDRPDNALST